LRLLIWSVLVVFAQLALVRTFSTLAGATAYYQNLFLLAGAFSAACGSTSPRLSRFVAAIPIFLGASLGLAIWIGDHNLIETITGEFLWTTVANAYPKPVDFNLSLAILLLAGSTVPLLALVGAGQGAAFRDGRWSSGGYIVMAAGGLGGGALFAAQNQLFPSLVVSLAAFSSLVAVALVASVKPRALAAAALVPLAVVVAVGAHVSARDLWSPYQRITTLRFERYTDALSNGIFIQRISSVPAEQLTGDVRRFIPFAPGKLKPSDRVVVVGSGAGTFDVREALRAGAGSVRAVEIDPVFIRLGLEIDPQRTYEDPRVHLTNGDGRHFLASTDERYELIFLAWIDSQTLASSQSRFRLDSFIYTVEGLRLAWSRRAPESVMVVGVFTGTPWIRRRIYDLLKIATGSRVRMFVPKAGGSWTLCAVSSGRDVPFARDAWEEVTSFCENTPPEAEIPTDDWPFLYSQHRRIPGAHLRVTGALLALLLAALAAIGWLDRRGEPDAPAHPRRGRLLAYAFFSGAAFFFLELRAISVLTPAVGSTYLAQASVVTGIIAASLAGALAAFAQRRLSANGAFALLFACLAAGRFAGMEAYEIASVGPALARLVAVTALPIGVAGYLYCLLVNDAPPATILSMQKWNLIGGAVGGMAECIVIITGFERALWIGAAFYALAWVALGFRHARRSLA
jgi:hypothetical protein